MKTRSIKQWVILPCTAKEAYNAWLDSGEHGKMVDGDDAKIDPQVGGEFSIWDDAITGRTLVLHPEKYRIVQSWRYNYDDWPKDQPGKITVEFVPYKDGQCKLRFWQSGVPEQHADEVAEGWKKYYWEPMKAYFGDKK